MQNIVGKWKRRSSVTDLPTGPKEPSSTVLTIEDEAVIAAFRKHTLLRLICRPAIPTWRLGIAKLTKAWTCADNRMAIVSCHTA